MIKSLDSPSLSDPRVGKKTVLNCVYFGGRSMYNFDFLYLRHFLSCTGLNQAINTWNEIPKSTEKPQALTGLTSKLMQNQLQNK